MGGPEKLARRKAAGLLQRARAPRPAARRRHLHRVGPLRAPRPTPPTATSRPADGKIAGFGKIDGREAAVVSNDFTVMGASSGATNGRKIAHMKRVATQRGLPIVFLGESSGARMPDHMGSRGMGTLLGNDGTQYQRTARDAVGLGHAGLLLRLVVLVRGALGLLRDAQGRGARGLERAARLARHQGGGRSRGARRLAAARGGHRASRTWSSTPTRRRSTPSSASSPTCRATTTRRRRCVRCPPAPARRWRTSCDLLPAKPHAGLRRAQGHPRRRRHGQLLRAEAALRQGGGHGARAPGRPHRRHRRQQPAATRAARSTPRPARRSRASSCCATRSTSRW